MDNNNSRNTKTSNLLDNNDDTSTSSSSSSSVSSSSSNVQLVVLLSNACGSALASIISRLCTHPLDTIKAQIQVQQQQQNQYQNQNHSNIIRNTTTIKPSSSSSSYTNILYTTLLQSNQKNGGLIRLYRGLGIVIIGGTPGTMMYLCTYDIVKHQLQQIQLQIQLQQQKHNVRSTTITTTETNNNSNNNNFMIHFISGMIAETIACIIYVPVDVIKERMQVQHVLQPPSSSSSSQVGTQYKYNYYNYRNSWDALQQIIQKEGIYNGIYRGYGATLASFGPFSAIYFVLYEYFKNSIHEQQQYYSYQNQHNNNNAMSKLFLKTSSSSSSSNYIDIPFHWTVLCAATAGGLASFITSPLDMAKLRLQVQRGTSGYTNNNNNNSVINNNINTNRIITNSSLSIPGRSSTTVQPGIVYYKNMLDCLQQIYQRDGIRGLFRGATARVIHFAPATTITMTMYETCRKQFESFFLLYI